MKKKVKIEGFDQFFCIGGECSITCCQEWKIAVDEETEKRWKAWEDSNPNAETLTKHIITKANQKMIRLNSDNQCPFLNDQKLCNLVIEHGDGMLSQTCARFPRQINDFTNRIEISLMSGCPAVIDQWNTVKRLEFIQEKLEDLDTEDDHSQELLLNPVNDSSQEVLIASVHDDSKEVRSDSVNDNSEAVLCHLRNKVITWIQDDTHSIEMTLMMVFYSLLELQAQGTLTERRIDTYFHKETFQALADSISQMKYSFMDQFYERNELFLDIVENYRKEKLYARYLDEIAKKAEQLSAKLNQSDVKKQKLAFQESRKPYEHLLRNYLAAEIFNNSIHQESDVESFIMMFQWIVLEYVTMRHAMFLWWLVSNSKQLPYEIVRDYMVVFSRMMGYEEKDIYEYLTNSYPDVIWDWGYLALIVGNNHK